MIAEHRYLERLIADLDLASGPVDVVAAAVATRGVFTMHLSKGRSAASRLDEAGLDLVAILDRIHEILGHAEAADVPAEADGGSGYGCGTKPHRRRSATSRT